MSFFGKVKKSFLEFRSRGEGLHQPLEQGASQYKTGYLLSLAQQF